MLIMITIMIIITTIIITVVITIIIIMEGCNRPCIMLHQSLHENTAFTAYLKLGTQFHDDIGHTFVM